MPARLRRWSRMHRPALKLARTHVFGRTQQLLSSHRGRHAAHELQRGDEAVVLCPAGGREVASLNELQARRYRFAEI